MYVKTTKSKGREYLYLVEDVYENGRKKTILIERLGRADLMSPEDLQALKDQGINGRRYTVAGIERHLSNIRSTSLDSTQHKPVNEGAHSGNRANDACTKDIHDNDLFDKSSLLKRATSS